MTSLTFDVFALAPLFGTAGVSDSPFVFLLIGLILYVAFLCGSRRLVDDIFKNDSPAQSPKRLVPWNVGTALVVFICCAFVLPLLAAKTIAALPKSCFPDFASVQVDAENEQANADDPNKLATQHPIVRLLARSRSTPWAFETFLLCFFVAVIAAPVAEEFLFRTLFQGTLENYALQAILPPPGTPRRPLADSSDARADAELSATEFRWTDPTTPMERRAFYLRSAFAIFVPAFVFGLLHAGIPETPEEARDPETLNGLFKTMLAAGLANVAALIFGLLVLRRSSGATTGDVGFGPEFTYKAGRCFASLRRFAFDFYRGVVVFAFIAPVIFGANATLRLLFPNAIVDPLPIFLFALVEGVVYWRLRRYATVVGMHVALNATSFALFCAFI